MNDKKKVELNLINDLCGIVNNDTPTSIDTVLARFFLENYHQISEMSATEIADACLVNRSSIHRFCKRLGYDNFKDMKADLKNNEKQYDYFLDVNRKDNFKHYLHIEIMKMLIDTDTLITSEILEEIAVRIHNSKEVVLISSYSETPYLQKFQRPLVLSGKLIRVFSNHFEEDTLKYSFLKKLDKDSFVIVISAKGMYAYGMNEYIQAIPAYKLLLTTSYREDIKKTYDKVLYLSKEDYTNQKSVHSEYGISFFFNLLYNTYFRLYGTL